jgi:hypothetical protein
MSKDSDTAVVLTQLFYSTVIRLYSNVSENQRLLICLQTVILLANVTLV